MKPKQLTQNLIAMKNTQYIQKTLLAFSFIFLGTLSAFAQWSASAGNAILTDASKSVGIGTSSPASKMHLVGTSNISRIQATGNIGYLSFYSNNTTYVGYAGVFNNANSMDFGTGGGNTTGKVNLVTGATPRLTVRSNGYVGIGTTQPWVRFEVRETGNDTTAMFYNSFAPTDNTVALGAQINPVAGNFSNAIAVKGVSNVSEYAGTGGWFAGGLYSGYFSNGEVFAKAKDGIHSLHVEAQNAEAGYFTASNGHGIVATGSGVGKYAGYFNGNVYATGTYSSSDARLKQHVTPVRNALSKIKELKPSTYEFKTAEFDFLNLPEGNQIGLMAQDLERVYPELVREVSADEHHCGEQCKRGEHHEAFKFKAINYTALIPVLVAGMQEQQAEIDAKDKKINELESRLARLERLVESLASGRAEVPAEIESEEGLPANQLLGNRPNPFHNATTIDFELAPEVLQAELILYDQTGRIIQRIALESRGKGSIEISMPNAPVGLYTYTIVADGKAMPAKQMALAGK